MATPNRSRTSGGPVDQLLEEVGGYLAAQANQLADKAVGKLGDLTDDLYDVADNGGSLADIGSRLLQGDSPLKAAVGSTFGGLKDKVKDIGSSLTGGGKGRKSGSKPTHICEVIDVGVPLRDAYDHWTRYENFSTFSKGVRSVSQGDDTTSDWKVKVGPSTRSWQATVQEQVPDDRIVWTSEGPKGTTRGCVSFHELAPSLTRVLVIVEYYPSGLFERTGNLWRAQGRRLRLDLKHFARYVTLSDEEPDGWRGEIRDGEVVRTHEEAVEEEEGEEEEGEEEEGEEEEGEEEEEGASQEDPEEQEGPEEYEDEAYEEEYPEDESGEEDIDEEEDEEEEEGEGDDSEDEGPDRAEHRRRRQRSRR
ncbi:SRPBCC family protein [Streptomyces sp. BR123]|uniref:SRPBCC family protein n=1 Tax=Streptomyces sp. BR123 TaxID=2749828 RepID=UPI0015C417AD|nr:SRPBCC family protein [Streptomyces sp. BR123]NXY95737.1 SRPBCC family protein [Streptomyces sp. BR123]